MKLSLIRRGEDDPRLLADLDRLAGRGASSGTEPAIDGAGDGAGTGARAAAASGVPGIDDPFVNGFVKGAVHLRRYGGFYLAGLAWLFVMIFIQPAKNGTLTPPANAGLSGFAQSASASNASPAAAAPAVAESTPFLSSDSYPVAAQATPAVSPDQAQLPSYDTPSSSSSSSYAATTPTTPLVKIPITLRIKEAGYASATGGTPLEQQPANGGLPVTAAGGKAQKASFVRLMGDTKVLKLAEATDPGSVANETNAVVKICPISTAGWLPTRGTAMSAAPTWDSPCVSGTRDATSLTWTFDLGDYEPLRDNGWALVPPDNVTQNSTFQITFKPTPVG